ncbi:phospholipase D-like domain-containing protein [Gordonia alkanivorans]|uniref:phospholipase D-like domain-containing protein n=1 Tax=Gordonia TaxID=2053 RepID=UPI0012BB39F4|nr:MULTISPECIES: phospholipase D-like domain-containing protein [Gordonia]MDH3016883.1 phospholipase D-like domain-containing protein [Gordonia alkanivorans]MDH3042128.1 phospholipase D-like domain-containing protein [Gordonia alkanivorans]MDH3060539.1 phospholipase D-like domain-containing protein [Gordonia alkanivorans]QGP87872.1 phospholipase [Gordonia sp. 135]
MTDEPGHEPILRAGDTCREIATADRVACIVDAADYFLHAKSALLQARRRVILIGWDVDTRISLDPRSPEGEVPDRLGEFLKWLGANRPGLEIYVLRWSTGAFTGLLRGVAPPFVQDLLTGRRLHFRIDAAHPVSAAHHQKIAVIDDQFAFCGGIDMTVDRWDTSEHLSHNDFRRDPDGEPHGPWHDVTVALDGDAARAVAGVAVDRWEAATGERLAPLVDTDGPDIWPEDLGVTFTDCEVGVARTIPHYNDRDEVDEIRRLYKAAFAAARRTIYIESQYLAAREIADALAERLAEPDGPEIVVVLPRHADSPVERLAMDGARHKLLRLLWRADVHDRFRAYYPVTSEGDEIYVHAKVLVVDDILLRIGSSNLNNRSLGFDSECDVAIEARRDDPDQAGRRDTITSMRTRLLSEHLGVDAEEFDDEVREKGSLIGAIESLATPGRTLELFDREVIEDEASIIAENELVDPEEAGTPVLERLYRGVIRYGSRIRPRRQGSVVE